MLEQAYMINIELWDGDRRVKLESRPIKSN